MSMRVALLSLLLACGCMSMAGAQEGCDRDAEADAPSEAACEASGDDVQEVLPASEADTETGGDASEEEWDGAQAADETGEADVIDTERVADQAASGEDVAGEASEDVSEADESAEAAIATAEDEASADEGSVDDSEGDVPVAATSAGDDVADGESVDAPGDSAIVVAGPDVDADATEGGDVGPGTAEDHESSLSSATTAEGAASGTAPRPPAAQASAQPASASAAMSEASPTNGFSPRMPAAPVASGGANQGPKPGPGGLTGTAHAEIRAWPVMVFGVQGLTKEDAVKALIAPYGSVGFMAKSWYEDGEGDNRKRKFYFIVHMATEREARALMAGLRGKKAFGDEPMYVKPCGPAWEFGESGATFAGDC